MKHRYGSKLFVDMEDLTEGHDGASESPAEHPQGDSLEGTQGDGI